MRFGERAELAAAARRRDILVGLGQGGVVAALVLAALYFFVGNKPKTTAPAVTPQAAVASNRMPPVTSAVPSMTERHLDLGEVRAPRDVTHVAAWAVRAADNGDRPFAIVDKRRAQVYVFAAGGRLLGTSPVLLGYAAGDLSAPGIGEKAIEDIRPQERTTPAGRFVSEPGRNALGHDVVWVDYDAAVSMHRVRATNPKERRLERLASKTAADNRISWGCINIPVDFFDRTVWPNLGKGRAVVYVLPEKRPLTAFFPDAAPQVLAQAGSRRGNNAKP
ncbi:MULTISPECIES: hypothetical protein [unclassified Roseateles]|uniref:hypothetical protein n=1 Tax=unclassified Roseateles TaxID=2626991 RepID=UPI0006F4B73A|nr:MULTISPECIES: hypothetical protein [unclassified Roseateles]KQW46613.1 hypothetical protein ASC81_09500 [Pelomonas sp. Root405]KRA73664.1 hypothetical protein ASD88_09500 [Pelomonas sp. Root662]